MMPIILEGSVIASAAVTTLPTSRLSPGCCAVILSAMAVDKTSTIANSIEIGVLEGTKEIPVSSKAGSFDAKTSYCIQYPCVLKEGQAIYARFDVPSNNDELYVVAHGYLRPFCL